MLVFDGHQYSYKYNPKKYYSDDVILHNQKLVRELNIEERKKRRLREQRIKDEKEKARIEESEKFIDGLKKMLCEFISTMFNEKIVEIEKEHVEDTIELNDIHVSKTIKEEIFGIQEGDLKMEESETCDTELKNDNVFSILEMKDDPHVDEIPDIRNEPFDEVEVHYVEDQPVEDNLDLSLVIDTQVEHGDILDIVVAHEDVVTKPSEVMNLSLQLFDGVKMAHIFIDPFAKCDDGYSNLRDYISPTSRYIYNSYKPKNCSYVPLEKIGSTFQHYLDLKLYAQVVFYPGISFLIFACCLRFVSASEEYDILLIRGRILRNREGMM